MELLGQIASVAGVSVFFAQFVQVTAVLSTYNIHGNGQADSVLVKVNNLTGVSNTQAELFGLYAGCGASGSPFTRTKRAHP